MVNCDQSMPCVRGLRTKTFGECPHAPNLRTRIVLTQRAGSFLPIKSTRVTSGHRAMSGHMRRTATSEGNLLANGRASGYFHQATIISQDPLSQTEVEDGQTTATPTDRSGRIVERVVLSERRGTTLAQPPSRSVSNQKQ